MTSLRVLLTRITTGWVWRRERRAAQLLRSFSRAEASSLLDLLAAARATSSAARRALYLRHALDEERHARVFSTRARELDPTYLGPAPSADFGGLYEALGELDFLAYVHRGEQRGAAQFELHRAQLRRKDDARGAALFDAILLDERRHASYTHELVLALAGSPSAARAALRRAAVKEALWTWRRAGRSLSALLFLALSSLLYLLLAPLAWWARRRPVATGWISTSDEAP